MKETTEKSGLNVFRLLEIFAIIVALSSVVIFVFYLLLAWNKCIIFTEPIAYIRWSEVVMGIISIGVLIFILFKKLRGFYGV